MGRKMQLVNVSVTDNGVQNGKRLWNVKVEAGAELFLLSDMLAKEGAIKAFDAVLRSANRAAVSQYISSGRELIKEAGCKGKKTNEAVAVGRAR
jgi:hypothetical protein